MNAKVVVLGIAVMLFGAVVASGVVPIGGSTVAAATVGAPSPVSCVAFDNSAGLLCQLTFVFSSNTLDCGSGVNSICGFTVDAYYCTVLSTSFNGCPQGDTGLYQALAISSISCSTAALCSIYPEYCSQSATTEDCAYGYADLLAGESVSVTLSFSMTFQPVVWFYVIVGSPTGEWSYGAGASGTPYYSTPSSGYDLVVNSPSSYAQYGCTTTPSGTVPGLAAGTVESVSAAPSCDDPSLSGTVTFQSWAVYHGTVSGGVLTWTSEGVSTSNPLSVTMDSEVMLNATYACATSAGAKCTTLPAEVYIGSVSVTGLSIVPSGTNTLAPGGSITYTVTAGSNYTLSGWKGWYVTPTYPSGSSTNAVAGTSTTFTVTYAELEPYFVQAGDVFSVFLNVPAALPVLTIKSQAGGTTTPAPGSYAEPAGSVVSVSETPGAGYRFTGWLLDGSPDGLKSTVSVTVSSATLLVAQFASSEITVGVYSVIGITTSPPAGSYNYTAPYQFSISETPASGYTFAGWYVNGSITPVSTASTYTATLYGSTTIVPSSSVGTTTTSSSTTVSTSSTDTGSPPVTCSAQGTDASLLVTVYSSDGSTVSGATVTVSTSSGVVSEAVTSSGGVACLGSIPVPIPNILATTGTVKVAASAPGFAPSSISVQVTEGAESTTQIIISPTTTTTTTSPSASVDQWVGFTILFFGLVLAVVGIVMRDVDGPGGSGR